MAPDSRLPFAYPRPFPPSSTSHMNDPPPTTTAKTNSTFPSHPSSSSNPTNDPIIATSIENPFMPLKKCSFNHPSASLMPSSSPFTPTPSALSLANIHHRSLAGLSSSSLRADKNPSHNQHLSQNSFSPKAPQSTFCKCCHQQPTKPTSSPFLTTSTTPSEASPRNLSLRSPKIWSCFFSHHSWALLSLVLALCLPKEARCGQHERRLLHDLLDNYNPLERPIANESDPVQVSFGITLQQIMDVDEKNQLLITNTWLKLVWNDVNLKWNETDYGGVKDLRIPPYKIWKPDVLMYNSADEGFDGTYQTKVVVSSDGGCLYIPPGIFKSTCKIDITWFPFDDQKCKMKFGSWTYSGWQLDLQLQDENGGDLSDFIKNGEWDLIGCPGKRNEIYYACCPEPYVDVTFEIIIRRRTLYYFCNLILPCVLIASMAVLGFTLPPDCGEKLSLGVTVLLSLTVFLDMVNGSMPTTSESVPLIGTYFNCIMFMVASSVVSTVLILNYHHRSADTHVMSPMVKSVFLQWMPWFLRMHRPGEKITRKTIMMNNKMRELELKVTPSLLLQERSSKSLLANVLDIDDDFRTHTLPPSHNTNNTTTASFLRLPHGGQSVDDSHLVHTCMSACTRELNLILKEVRVITDKMRKDEEESEVTNDWRFAAMVVDRLCLIVFTLFTITATVAVLLSAPHIMVP